MNLYIFKKLRVEWARSERKQSSKDSGYADLVGDAVDGFVLLVNLIAHVDGHVLQISDDAAHCVQVLLHLIFPSIICYPDNHKKKSQLHSLFFSSGGTAEHFLNFKHVQLWIS